ncbi:restriction endonuclease subunit S [Enterococcus sp. C50]|uniref:restriction endonuclease subunit S n=1 Tax=Enterococcus sp. C50 TaxID=3231311 RepID=UPI0034A0A900
MFQAWEQRKFEELLNKKDGVRRGPFGSALKKEIFVPKSDYVVYEQQNAIYDNYETRYNITESKFRELSKFSLTEGDFIMSGAGTIGRISRVPIGIKQGVFNQALIRFKINTEVTDSEYFIQFVRADNMQRKLTGANPGSAITNLVPMSEVKKWDILVPSKREQQEIGAFFKQLDDTITLHQQKLDQLKRLKQGLLQVLFANKEQVPKVRFAGFDEEWEQRKLGGIFKKYTQKNKDLEFHSDSVISVAKMKLSPPSAKSSDEYMKTYNKIWKGNIAFEGHTNDEFPNGRFVLNDCQNGIVSHIYDVYSAVDEYNNEFMKRYINNPDVMRKILINATSSARMMKSLNSIEFLKQSILLPILSEQQKIGSFFKQLDDAIALHQTKLEKLKQLKKAFLQKMFI